MKARLAVNFDFVGYAPAADRVVPICTTCPAGRPCTPRPPFFEYIFPKPQPRSQLNFSSPTLSVDEETSCRRHSAPADMESTDAEDSTTTQDYSPPSSPYYSPHVSPSPSPGPVANLFELEAEEVSEDEVEDQGKDHEIVEEFVRMEEFWTLRVRRKIQFE